MQKAFRVDLNLCTGCHACELACQIENELPIDAAWRTVHTTNSANIPSIPVIHLSLACNHCETPACLINCPALAFTKEESTGAVTIDADKCMGCRYCSWVCPFDAPSFVEMTGVMYKCNFCHDRQEVGLAPACVSYCPTGALGLQDHRGKQAEEATARPVGFPESDLGPAIEFVPFRGESTKTAGDEPFFSPVSPPPPPSKITLRSEWTLLLFTFIIAVLVGSFAGLFLRGESLHPLVFLVPGFLAMALSTFHLGQPLRAYRAILNWRRSWLSREVLFVSSFLFVGGLQVLAPWVGFSILSESLALLAMPLGILALVSMDQVYGKAATTRSIGFHSGSTVLVGGFALVAILGSPVPLVLLAGVKGVLYVLRQGSHPGSGRRIFVGFLRLFVGLGMPCIFAFWGEDWRFALIVCALFGEVIDRAQFYDELEIVTPSGQLRMDQAEFF